MYYIAVLTSAHCCQPRLDDTTIKAIAITIGATSIRYSDTFGVKPLLMHNPGAHHAILQNPTQGEEIHIPAGYTTSDSNPEWDVCLIELEDEDGRHARADIGGISTLLPSPLASFAWAQQLCTCVMNPMKEFWLT